ncbi:Hypothetical protein ORPV_377 [Orpheovirus IHUMI-LCC2]|uniref:Uncharacterized protein n=1 Tax=Orpheovirus IHUMI-LCC2 TaxID=2023057 RepID=A0A2I2L443_9VIRU|nr:Hypothetical protein ORPV_377 [Orpheovirus IHUMI-LCC2]SNW62281.1 Hypothetical protein ORPV_377 [Orpheovirus IHUMI-LCC2]
MNIIIYKITSQVFKPLVLHKVRERGYPCNGPSMEEERNMKIHELKVKLCKSNSLLIKAVNGLQFSQRDKQIYKELFDEHKKHRIEDLQYDRDVVLRGIEKIERRIKDEERDNNILLEMKSKLHVVDNNLDNIDSLDSLIRKE